MNAEENRKACFYLWRFSLYGSAYSSMVGYCRVSSAARCVVGMLHGSVSPPLPTNLNYLL